MVLESLFGGGIENKNELAFYCSDSARVGSLERAL